MSDGLLGDLNHILRRSAVAATVDVDALPRSSVLGAQALALQRVCTLAGGDDYELVFSASRADANAVVDAAARARTPVTRIGRIEAGTGVRLVDAGGRPVENAYASFDHFRS